MQATRTPNIVFIYYNGEDTKVLTLDDAKIYHKDMLLKGYYHTGTIDACDFIERLCNMITKTDINNAVQCLKMV